MCLCLLIQFYYKQDIFPKNFLFCFRKYTFHSFIKYSTNKILLCRISRSSTKNSNSQTSNVNHTSKLSHPLDDGGSDDNDIDPSELKRKKSINIFHDCWQCLEKTQKVLMKDAIESVLKKTIKKEVIFLKSDRLKVRIQFLQNSSYPWKKQNKST
mgnify:CR=1 FL=1